MIKEEYSPYKIVHQHDKLEDLRMGRQTAPVQVHLVPSNRCNQSCGFAYRMPESSSNQNFDDKDIIPTEKLFEIIESCKVMGVQGIQFTGGGEPLVHPDIKCALRLTKKLGLKVGLVTNGQALDDELIDILSDVSWVRISMDAVQKGTYSILRRTKGSNFDKVVANIEKLALKKSSTILGVGFVVCRDNYSEIFDACALYKDLGIDNFRISAAFTPLGFKYFDGILEPARLLAQKAKDKLEGDKYTVFNLFGSRIGDLFCGDQDYDFCPIKEIVTYIGADLNVYTCCVLAYNDMGYIGTLKGVRFEELWDSERKINFFKKHSPRKFCRLPCMFEGKNEFINYCINRNPTHIEFV